MIVINLTNLANAIKKARQMKPRVQFVAFRTYVVKSPNSGNVYTVTFSVNPQNGAKQGHCTCKAGQAGVSACWHLAACLQLHQIIQGMRTAARESKIAAEMIALNPS